MQKIIYFFLISFLSLSLSAQPYYVVSVKGSVSANGKLLEKKDKIDEEAQLRFGSAGAFAYVVSPGKGYFVLSPKKIRTQQENEFLVSLKEAVLPPNEFNATSTRNVWLVLPLSFTNGEEIQRFFRGDVTLISGTRFEVNTDQYALDEAHQFALRQSSADSAAIYPLPDSANIFVIDEEAGLASTKQMTPVSLIYLDHQTGENQALGEFNLTLLTRPSVLEELRQLYEAVTPVPTEVFLRDHAQPYLEKMYGNIQPEVVRQLVESAFRKEK